MKYNGVTIHSSYSPERDASRFVDNLNIKDGRYLFLISGAGAGFLYKELTRRYPDSIILSIFYNRELYTAGYPGLRNSWIFGSGVPLRSFLNSQIPDYMLPALRLIEWEPCARAFPYAHSTVSLGILSFIEERNASIVTTVNFSRRWFRNAILNIKDGFSFLDPSYFNIEKPVLITAAGPSLSHSFPLINKYRSRLFIAALPSSLKSLYHNSIKPDLIVNTDPGFWNRYHFAFDNIKDIPIAMPLTASFNRYKNPVFIINQDTVLEKILFDYFNFPFVLIPENGTVAVTAIRLALKLSKHPVFISGLDLDFDDIHEHVAPHSFTTLLRTGENRLFPYISILFDRKIKSLFKGSSRAYNTYANWLNNTDLGNRLYRINPSRVSLNNFIGVTDTQAGSIISGISVNSSSTPSEKKTEFNDPSSICKLFKYIVSGIEELKKECHDIKSFRDLTAFLGGDSLYSSLLQIFSLDEIIKAVGKLSANINYSRNDIIALLEGFIDFIKEGTTE